MRLDLSDPPIIAESRRTPDGWVRLVLRYPADGPVAASVRAALGHIVAGAQLNPICRAPVLGGIDSLTEPEP